MKFKTDTTIKTLLKPMMLFFIIFLVSCGSQPGNNTADKDLFAMDNLVAWCIVPYDAENRGPYERARMLDELGFEKLAWDWRSRHLKELPEEIEALKKHDIKLTGVWFSLGGDSRDGLTSAHHQIIDAIVDAGVKTTYWVSISDAFFTGSTDQEKVEEGVNALEMVYEQAQKTGSRVALYNHGGWAGEPENQVRILEKLGRKDAGIVFNFHHAHHRIEDFKQLLNIMMPYIYTVNLNGMNKEGPKIMDIGSGNYEASMIKTLKESEFNGTVGILGHIAEKDVEKVLNRNLQGLQRIIKELD